MPQRPHMIQMPPKNPQNPQATATLPAISFVKAKKEFLKPKDFYDIIEADTPKDIMAIEALPPSRCYLCVRPAPKK